jgi:hypothetical protein
MAHTSSITITIKETDLKDFLYHLAACTESKLCPCLRGDGNIADELVYQLRNQGINPYDSRWDREKPEEIKLILQ